MHEIGEKFGKTTRILQPLDGTVQEVMWCGVGIERIVGTTKSAAAGRAVAEDYKYGSYNIHPAARSFGMRLGLMGRHGILTGASNAGLELPAVKVAESLTLATAFFSHSTLVSDSITVMKAAKSLRDQMLKAAPAARDQLYRDQEAIESAESAGDE